MSLVIAQLRYLSQAVPPHSGQVDGRCQGVQRLVGADVGSGPLATDVLFPRLQGEDIAGAPLGIGGATHQTAGHLAYVLLLAAEQTQVWPAEGRRDADGLSFSRDDVRPELARWAQHPHGQRVGGHHEERPVVVGGGGQTGQIVQFSVEIGILGHDAGGRFGDGAGSVGSGHHVDGNALGLAVSGNHLLVGRVHRIAHDHLLPSGDPAGHEHRFGQAGRAVVHTGVGDFHAVEGADHRLKLEDDLQSALGYFGLIRSVSGQELAPGHHGLNDGRNEVVVRTGAQEGGPAGQRPVSPGHFAELALDLQLRHRIRQLQRRVSIPVGYVGEQVVNGAEANGRQQLVLLLNGIGNVVRLEVGYHSRLLRLESSDRGSVRSGTDVARGARPTPDSGSWIPAGRPRRSG